MNHVSQLNAEVRIKGRVVAILKDVVTGEEKIIRGANIITDEGDKFYAQQAMGETPTINFDGIGGLRLGTDDTTPTKSDPDVGTFLSGSGHAITATYPKTDDQDARNTGAGVDIGTWLYEYATDEGNGVDIVEGAIVDHLTTPTAALNHFLFDAPFTKTTSNTLAVFVNSQFNGV